MSLTNTLAYYDTATITAIKSFIPQALSRYFRENLFPFIQKIGSVVCSGKNLKPSLIFA
jgi:hypothetical protein